MTKFLFNTSFTATNILKVSKKHRNIIKVSWWQKHIQDQDIRDSFTTGSPSKDEHKDMHKETMETPNKRNGHLRQ